MAASPTFSLEGSQSRLQERAALLARRELADSPRRYAHTQAVVRQAAKLARRFGRIDPQRFPSQWRDRLVAAAWVHDIGYSKGALRTGFHPLDGALFLEREGLPSLAWLVALHSGAEAEASARNLEPIPYAVEDEASLVCLTYADLTSSSDGERVTVSQRITEILSRYPVENPVSVACEANQRLYASVERQVEDWPNPSFVQPSIALFDLDGTLLHPDSSLSAAAVRVLSARSRKVRIVLASGKHDSSFRTQAHSIDPSAVRISCGGCMLKRMESDTQVLGSVSSQDLVRLTDVLKVADCDYALYTPTRILAPKGANMSSVIAIGESVEHVLDVEAALGGETVLKVLSVIDNKPENADIERQLRRELASQLLVNRTGQHFLEFSNPLVDKGTAAHLIASERGDSSIVCFGDAENDLPMFYQATWAVAVANARPEVIDAADEVCESNADDGAVNWIASNVSVEF